jgi:hypothetical protein
MGTMNPRRSSLIEELNLAVESFKRDAVRMSAAVNDAAASLQEFAIAMKGIEEAWPFTLVISR